MTKSRFLKPRDIIALLALAAGIAVLWLDVKTGIWQEIVILSGIVAGLLTFLMTALYIESWLARADHKRWQPVTRLALTDLLKALANEELSEISRGKIVPRTIAPDHSQVLLNQVVDERERITEALARWSSFLAASADVQQLMVHIAELAETLDEIRDCVLELEAATSDERSYDAKQRELVRLSDQFNRTVVAAINEIEAQL